MRISFPLLLLMLASIAAPAQPFKSALTGPVVKNADSLDIEITPQEITEFLPEKALISTESSVFFPASTTKPGVAFLSSAIIPGSGQALNGKWGRAAAYFLVEAVSLAYYFDQNSRARDRERDYEAYANQNWSVLAYAQWLVDYSVANNLTNGYEQLQNELASLSEADRNPNFNNTTDDWRKVRINTIRAVEVRTPFIFNNPSGCGANDAINCSFGSDFSHVVQDYGSQQYYELMSKYYQFQPGWKDFHEQRMQNANHAYQYSWTLEMTTENFRDGRDQAERFNDNYRRAGNIINLLLVNHVVSAFDAFFTVKLKNSRLETQANFIGDESVSLIWHF